MASLRFSASRTRRFFQMYRLPRARWIFLALSAAFGAVIFAAEAIDHLITTELHWLVHFLLVAGVIPLLLTACIFAVVRVRREALADRAVAVAEERRQLSRELHDSIAQHLCFLTLKLDTLASDTSSPLPAAVRDDLEQMRAVANTAYEDVYYLLSDLRMTGAGHLADSLLDWAKWIGKRAGFEAQLTVSGEPRLLTPCALHQIQNIVREALANIEKHAAARNVLIDLDWRRDVLAIEVRDDGRGFDPRVFDRRGHFGLSIMRERAAEIGGTVVVDSQPSVGTSIRFTAPLREISPALATAAA